MLPLYLGYMKLQKQKGREYKGKVYAKYFVTIPKKDLEKLGWTEGQELKGIVADGMYILRPKE